MEKKEVQKMPQAVKLNFEVPTIKDMLKAGSQFGHQTKRWNPKMKPYIYTEKGDIHIIDLNQTEKLLQKALEFLVKAASEGEIVFIGTKRQAVEFIVSESDRSGSHFIIHRWPGGFFTNFKMINRSLKRLNELESDFERGIEGRTKYEISLMKREWERLNRLYQGVKKLESKPKAVIIVDPNYEKNAIFEAKKMGIPIVAIVDTNANPDGINYVIPANDDAINSIKLFMKAFADAIIQGNGGKGVKYQNKDYAKMEIKIIRNEPAKEEVAKEAKTRVRRPSTQPEAKPVVKEVKKEEKKEEPKAKKETKAPAKKETKKAVKTEKKPVAKKAAAKKPATKTAKKATKKK